MTPIEREVADQAKYLRVRCQFLLGLASVSLTVLLTSIFSCRSSISFTGLSECPAGDSKTMSQCQDCSDLKNVLFSIFLGCLLFTLLMAGACFADYICLRRLKKENGNDRHSRTSDLESARSVELSDWTTYDRSITAPLPVYSTRPGINHFRFIPFPSSTAGRSNNPIAPPPAYRSTETLPSRVTANPTDPPSWTRAYVSRAHQ